jgi:hypothetical protein
MIHAGNKKVTVKLDYQTILKLIYIENRIKVPDVFSNYHVSDTAGDSMRTGAFR